MDSASHIAHDVVTAAPTAKWRSGKLVGLAVVSIVPALFWTALLALLGPLLGFGAGTLTLTLVGVGIAVFLGLIFSALVLSS